MYQFLDNVMLVTHSLVFTLLRERYRANGYTVEGATAGVIDTYRTYSDGRVTGAIYFRMKEMSHEIRLDVVRDGTVTLSAGSSLNDFSHSEQLLEPLVLFTITTGPDQEIPKDLSSQIDGFIIKAITAFKTKNFGGMMGNYMAEE